MRCNTVVNGQKEKPIFVGMGLIDDSGFLILRIETNRTAGKFTTNCHNRSVICSLLI
jgi:hypothetical protein